MAPMPSIFFWLALTLYPPAAHASACLAEGAIPVPHQALENSLDAPLPAHSVFAWKENGEWRFALLPLSALEPAPARERIARFALSGLPALRLEMKQLTLGTPLTFRALDPELSDSFSSLRSDLFEAASDAGVALQIPL